MKQIFVLLILSIISISSAINFDISGNSIQISGNFNNLELSEQPIQNDTFMQVQIKDCVSSGKVGEPKLPIYTQLVTLPDFGNYILENISYDEKIIELDKAILPSGFLNDDEINSGEYQRDVWLPSELVTISDPSIMGAYRFSQIAVSPIQYNSFQKKIRIIKNIEIKLILDETNTKNPKLKQSSSNSFSNIAKSMMNGSNP